MISRGAVVLWGLLCAADACAQVSGRVAAVSDYRYRGISLSDNRPAAQASIAYDGIDGWYAGAFASTLRLRLQPQADPGAQLVTYLGYGHRLRGNLRWEIGAEYAAFVGHSDYDYPEVYVGLVADHFSSRLYYAPRYFGADSAVVYAELNGDHALSERVRLLGHVGWLRRHGDDDVPFAHRLERHRFDARVGLGTTRAGLDLELAWVASDGGGGTYAPYPVGSRADHNTWLLSVSRSW